MKKLEIQPGCSWDVEGNYSYIRGRVRNTGDSTVRYFKVAVAYKDEAGDVLDTAYTNSGETLRPGWSKEFEIMHRHREEYKQISIWVEKVSIE